MKEIIVAERQDFIDVANAIRTKAGSNVQLSFPEGMIEAIENIKIGSSGGGSSSGTITLKPDYLDIPEIYKPYIAYAKRQYTGSYEYLAVLDWREHVAVMFILDNFGIDEYEPEMSEFKAHGWVSWSYDRNTEEWTFNDWRNETSTGGNYVMNIKYSSTYWEYDGQVIWPYNINEENSDLVYRPHVWNDEGEYSFFYLDFLKPVASFSPAQLMECVMVHGNGTEIDITNVEKVDDRVVKIFCNLNNQTSGVQVYGCVNSWLSFANGQSMPEFTVAFNVAGLSTTITLAYVYDTVNLPSFEMDCDEDIIFKNDPYVNNSVIDTILIEPPLSNYTFFEEVSITYS